MPTNERNIETISFGRGCRTRLGMYLSGEPEEALRLGLREIYVNSLDAITETGIGGTVHIIIDSKNRIVQVIDDGPGIPYKLESNGKSSIEMAYTQLHTGSHFNAKAVNAIGTNGVGAKVVCHTAKQFTISNNDGKTYDEFIFNSNDDGAHLVSCRHLGKGELYKRGVSIEYIPDTKVYGDVWFDEKVLIDELAEMMKFYPKVTLVLDFDKTRTMITFPDGLKEKNTKMYYESDNLIISLGIADENSEPIKAYGNRLYLPQGGKFFTHFKTQMTKQINTLSGLKLTGTQVQSQFTGSVCIFVDKPLFSNQAKTSIANTEVNTEISSALTKLLNDFSKTKEWERMVKILEGELKAEEAAERARKKIKDALDGIKKGSKKKSVVAEKLKDCIETGENAWLAISEGDSGMAGLLTGRDIETVAIFPVRGKGVNCLKAAQEDYLENQELQQLFSTLGCGIFEDYSSKKLKYGNLLLAVDADEDGKSIMALILTMFYVCAPQFLKEGRMWWMRAPLYYNASKHQYIFTEEDWKKVKNKSGFTRAKGIGEYNPEAVKEALFGKYKRWEQLKITNWETFSQSIELLMGKDTKGRKDYLFRNIDFERIKFL